MHGKNMIRATVAALLLAPALALAQPARVAALDWLSGTWVHADARQRVWETWIGPANGVMAGANLTAWENGRNAFEFMRIGDTADGISYYASPRGRPAVEFRMKEMAPGRVVFENPEHDFPQRIVYWKEGDGLAARIEGTVKGQPRSEEWRFKPAR
jgi:hypothetical protein